MVWITKFFCHKNKNVAERHYVVFSLVSWSELARDLTVSINLLKSTGHVMHQQFNIQQLYVLPTLYLCVLYLSENKQRLVPITA